MPELFSLLRKLLGGEEDPMMQRPGLYVPPPETVSELSPAPSTVRPNFAPIDPSNTGGPEIFGADTVRESPGRAERRVEIMNALEQSRNPEEIQAMRDKTVPSVPGQILRNFANALQFTPRGGRISSALLGSMNRGKSGAEDALNQRLAIGDKLEKGLHDFDAQDLAIEKDRREGIDWKRKDRVSEAEADVNSPTTKYMQMMVEKADKLTPEQKQLLITIPGDQLKSQGKYVQDLRDTVMKQEDNIIKREDQRQGREQSAQLTREGRQQSKEISDRDFEARQDNKKNEKDKLLTELQTRKQNLIDSVDILNKMIDEKGTFEAFGPHNARFNQLVNNIAIDMAKFKDPASTARESEVQNQLNTLPTPTAAMTNATAKSLLNAFKEQIERETENAYSARKLQMPGSKELGNDKTKDNLTPEKQKRLDELRRKAAAK